MPGPNSRDTVFHEWGRKYGTHGLICYTKLYSWVSTGDVFILHVLGKPIVIINSEKAAVELMEKRSAIYSDRPRAPILEK